MTSLAFDTHASVKKLKDAGFTEQQAEAQVEVLVEIIESNLVTKRDLKEVEAALKLDIAEVKRDVEALRLATKHDLEVLKQELRAEMWRIVGAQTIVLIGVMVALKIFT